jgi:hypothetical protein
LSENIVPVLTVVNSHSHDCGDPPDIVVPIHNMYTGYYENCHGEQFILQWDFGKTAGWLRGGDLGWEQTKNIVFTQPQMERLQSSHSLTKKEQRLLEYDIANQVAEVVCNESTLDSCEFMWVAACLFTILQARPQRPRN